MAEQLRLGSTPEVVLQEDADLLTARYYSRAARDLAQQINRKKNQLRSSAAGLQPSPRARSFPGAQLHHPAVYALLQSYLFPDEFVQAGADALAATLTRPLSHAFGLASRPNRLVDASAARPSPGPSDGMRSAIGSSAHPRHHHLPGAQEPSTSRPAIALIEDRAGNQAARDTVKGAGVSNTLALVTEIGDVQRFPSGEHLASFLGLTTSKHISGTTLFRVQADHQAGLAQRPLRCRQRRSTPEPARAQVPGTCISASKAANRRVKGHFIALVAVARDFVTNVLYDMWRYQRPFFLEVDDYRDYRRKNPRSDD